MRQIDTRSARIFLTIAEEGSIAKAAAREHMVPSAVSKRLQELEEVVGVCLVERSQRGITLTPAGEAMAHHSRLIVQAIDKMQAEMGDYVNGVRGHLRVRVSASALAIGLPSVIETFVKQHADVRLDLEELETPLIVREVAEARADIGIGPNIFTDDRLQLLPLASYDLVVAVPAGHVLTALPEVFYEQTLAHEHVEQPQSSALSQLLDYAAKQSSLTKRTRIRVRGFDAVCHMIGLGMGIGIVPSILERMYGGMHNLRFIPLRDSWAHPVISIMFRDRATLPSAAQAFVAHLEKSAIKSR